MYARIFTQPDSDHQFLQVALYTTSLFEWEWRIHPPNTLQSLYHTIHAHPDLSSLLKNLHQDWQWLTPQNTTIIRAHLFEELLRAFQDGLEQQSRAETASYRWCHLSEPLQDILQDLRKDWLFTGDTTPILYGKWCISDHPTVSYRLLEIFDTHYTSPLSLHIVEQWSPTLHWINTDYLNIVGNLIPAPIWDALDTLPQRVATLSIPRAEPLEPIPIPDVARDWLIPTILWNPHEEARLKEDFENQWNRELDELQSENYGRLGTLYVRKLAYGFLIQQRTRESLLKDLHT